jgi:hypothetical protein
MSRWNPCRRNDFIRRLRRLGFEGLYSGGKHRLTIPSNTEYSVPQLRMMLREVELIIGREVTADEWNKLS